MTQPKSYRDVQKSKICAGVDYDPRGGRKPGTWDKGDLTEEIVKLFKSKEERTLPELASILNGHPDKGTNIAVVLKVMEALGMVEVRLGRHHMRIYRWVKND